MRPVTLSSHADRIAVMRRQLARPMPVLTLIALYNSALRYILRFLGFLAPLGEAHRRQIAEAAAGMHDGLFGAGHGVLEELRRRWQGAPGGAERRIPEVLFYWPLTAGGLGLFNPVTALAAYDGPAAGSGWWMVVGEGSPVCHHPPFTIHHCGGTDLVPVLDVRTWPCHRER